MASNSEKAELLEPDATGIPRTAQVIAVIPAKHRVGVLEGAERNYLQAVQDSDGAEAAPLTLHVNEDLLRYLADEADKSGRSLSSEIVHRLLHSRAQDAQHGALQQIESTAIAVESTMDAVQQLLTLIKPSPPVGLPGLDHAERWEKRS
jgi:hypothetical protein